MVMSALVGLVVPGRYLIDNPKYVVWCHTYEGNFRFNITPRLNWGKKDLWRFFYLARVLIFIIISVSRCQI